MKSEKTMHGWTLLELMVTIGVAAILAAVALALYSQYQMRARSADLAVRYDAIRTGAQVRATVQAGEPDCAEMLKGFGTSNLDSPYAGLSYGLEAAKDGFRPVLSVCAQESVNGAMGVKVARAAHDNLARNTTVEKGAVLTDTVVSFALPLTTGDKAMCTIASAVRATPCGTAATATPSNGCPPGKEPYEDRSQGSGATVRTCVDSCGPGQVRDPKNFRWCTAAPAGAAGTQPGSAGPAPGNPSTGTAPPDGKPPVPAYPPPGSSTSPNAPKFGNPTYNKGFSTQTRVLNADSYWLSGLGPSSPDGSPMRIVAFQIEPPTFATATGGPGNWVVTFPSRDMRGKATVTITVQNDAGMTTTQFTISKNF